MKKNNMGESKGQKISWEVSSIECSGGILKRCYLNRSQDNYKKSHVLSRQGHFM